MALNLKSGVYYRLNGSAATAYRLLSEGLESDGLTERLLEEYDVDRATLGADLEALLADLESAGLAVRDR